MGFGLKVDSSMFDARLAAALMGVDIVDEDHNDLPDDKFEDELWESTDFEDVFLNTLIDLPQAKATEIDWCSTGNMDNGAYLYYPADLAWRASSLKRHLDDEAAKDNIISLLRPYLKKDIDLDELRELIDDVFYVGCD